MNEKKIRQRDMENANYETRNRLFIDFSSEDPLELELLHVPLITEEQFFFIKDFQRAFYKKKEQKSTMLYEPQTIAKNKNRKFYFPIEEIVECSRDYYKFVYKYGDEITTIIENYFCNNLTMKKLKEKYIARTVIKETKEKRRKNGKIKKREIERIIEHFDEKLFFDDLLTLIKILNDIDKIEKNEKEDDEYEKMINCLENIAKSNGKYEVCKMLKIDYKTLIKILNGYKNYPYVIYEKIKKMVMKGSVNY